MKAFIVLTFAVAACVECQGRVAPLPHSAFSNPPNSTLSWDLSSTLAADTGYVWGDERATAPKSVGGHKSYLTGIGLSLLVPGAGQYYAGARSQGRLFMGIEAAVWASYIGLGTYAGWKKDDFIRFAERHAGVDPTVKSDEYFRTITFYESRDDYNTLGRAVSPEAPYFDQSYDWRWESPAAQQEYRELRNAFNSADRNRDYMLVAAGVNRLVAAVFSWRAVKKANSRLDETSIGSLENSHTPSSDTNVRLLSVATDGGGLLVSLTKKF